MVNAGRSVVYYIFFVFLREHLIKNAHLMAGRSVVLLCNLKPAKMRGVLSQAMVMCASSPDKVGYIYRIHIPDL